MDSDSDPEFRSGAYVPTPAPKRKAEKAILKANSKKRKVDTSSKYTSTTIGKTGLNPLLKYFGELDLYSASEDEDDNEDEDSAFSSLDLKTVPEKKSVDVTSTPPTPSKDGPSPKTITTVGEEDDTEPESEEEIAKFRAISCQKQKPMPGSDDDTETESESDFKLKTAILPFKPAVIPIKRPYYGSDADTESESESEILYRPPVSVAPAAHVLKCSSPEEEADTEEDSEPDIAMQKYLEARPGFPLNKEQKPLNALVLDQDQGVEIPSSINTYLRDYQRDGVKFLYRQYQQGCGGLLGDDMGLGSAYFFFIWTSLSKLFPGKTVQIISFLSAIMKKQGNRNDRNRRHDHVSKLQDGEEWRKHKKLPPANATWPTCLIIAPSTVVHNWEREFETWGYFEVGLYNGTPKEREEVLRDFKLGRLDVVLTTFDLARKDIEVLDDLAWSCVIVDEVHRVKNEASKLTKAYHQFRCLRRFGLTGTTIQNSYKEMWTILHWTNPGAVGSSKQWNGYVSKPLLLGQSARATEEQRATGLIVAQILRDKLLPNFFLRRTKDIIKDQLPKKLDQVVFCPLTETQIAAYKRILQTEAVTNLLKSREKCECGSHKQRKNCCHPPVAGDVFRFMSALIKLSNHLGLILPGPNDTAEQTLRNRELADMAFPDGPIPKFGTAMMQAKYCGKWKTLEVLLTQWRREKSNKVLIFTKSVKLLDMLEFHLSSKSYRFLKLDGSTKQSDRMPMIDSFNNDPDVFVFLISTLAGGTGLNLTGANKVVIFDPNWNPAHDLQAMDRAFRFGQTRDVDVFRLLGAGSIEELIYARQIYKQQQMAIGYDASVQTRYFEGIQGDNQNRGELFGIENIFKLHEGPVTTKIAIEKAALAELDWALANMESKKKSGNNNLNGEILEASQKLGKDDGGLRGLASLLFDDATPKAKMSEQDIIQQTLKNIGVKYSHVNDEILLPSRIEALRTKMTLQKKNKKEKTKAQPKAKKAVKKDAKPKGIVWPTRKPKQKTQDASSQAKTPSTTPATPPDTELHERLIDKLTARKKALIALDCVKSPQDIPNYALRFIRETEAQHDAFFATLDNFIKDQMQDDDDSSD
ncbi:hypothetical protein CVT24_004978 [Panaeolus cyanescens]|uniref:DNA excision repair protein ERCC-6-like 2 n=1 Tax=Panaeolus cyanescens TaxID=181874 RepID=A0A409V9M9_9AGAR|nr:hypothetical protein CVT24_004978 [Panaeolus cyanescens]